MSDSELELLRQFFLEKLNEDWRANSSVLSELRNGDPEDPDYNRDDLEKLIAGLCNAMNTFQMLELVAFLIKKATR